MQKIGKVAMPCFVALLLVLGCAETSGDCPVNCGNLECCDGLCVDLQSNAAHCGYCNRACTEGQTCRMGECVETCGGMICSSTQTCCDDVCTDTRSSTQHCGGCGNACDPGQICTAGSCEALTCDPECEAGETCCRVGTTNTCVDLQTDRNNCGLCGETCGLNETCKAGVCSADVCEPPCPEGQHCCSDVCVDRQTDPNNCGFCGNTCDEVRSDGCTAGQCSCRGALECRTDQECCEGIGCRNINTDPSNCGECGYTCKIGESCMDGACSCGGGVACEPNESCCSGTCLDTMSDSANCGNCGTICGASAPDCVSGTCMCGTSPACQWPGGPWVLLLRCQDAESGDFSAFNKCCDGACMPMSDTNCGNCGTACEGDTVCTAALVPGQCLFTCETPVTP
jgi:hypothetical protein